MDWIAGSSLYKSSPYARQQQQSTMHAVNIYKNVKIPQLFMKIIHLKLLKRVSTILDLHFNLPGLN
jgi:hypothetical protein